MATATEHVVPAPVPRAFWWVIGLLFTICLLNYFDRQTLSILKTTLKNAFGFDDLAYSHLVLAFMLPYIVMYVLSGWIIDRLGTRRAMSLFVVGWSSASIFSGLSQSFGQLAASRALLGAAEPITFPLSQRVILNWAPERRRAFTMSLIAPAGSVGAVLAPPLVAFLTLTLGWRGAFLLPGMIGLAIALLWWKFDRLPAERVAATAPEGPLPVRDLLSNRAFWGIVAARLVSDPVWYFFLFWIPGYLQERVGLTLSQLGLVGGIPYLVALVACPLVGYFVDARARGGRPAARVQIAVFTAGALLMPVTALITAAPDVVSAMIIITLVTTIAQLWFSGTGVLLAACLPHHLNTTASGFIGALGATAGLLLNLVAGPIVQQFGYAVAFAVLGLLHPLGALILWLTIACDLPARTEPAA